MNDFSTVAVYKISTFAVYKKKISSMENNCVPCISASHSILELHFQNTSSRRLKGLESLQEFIQAATQELVWLNEKEEIEVTRDWSSRHLNVPTVEEFYKVYNSHINVAENNFTA